MASLLMLSYLIKVKFRRKDYFLLLILTFLSCFHESFGHSISPSSPSSCGDVLCFHGICLDGKCICDQGWQGSACHRCGGRIKLTSPSGFITDGIGNYSTDLQCTWLIDTKYENAVIRLQIVHFETECSWDHLYIFDGDSVFAPMLAAYSGLLVKNDQIYQNIPEIVALSGKAYLYFYSDAAYNMSGFNISYSINTCPKNCSGHGACITGLGCTCNAGWDGEGCDQMVCPNDCSSHGICDKEQRKCICDFDYAGPDCSQIQHEGYWNYVDSIDKIKGRSLHQTVLYDDSMWVIGGEFFDSVDNHFMIKFDFTHKKWEEIKSNDNLPSNRFGHSAVVFQDFIFVYGGILKNGSIVNELWTFDIRNRIWEIYNENLCVIEYCSPFNVMGHTATVVDSKMIVIFGYNPTFGYLNIVQEYNFFTKRWNIVKTKGALVKGGFGHSSVYDSVTKVIYVFGGYHSYGASDTILVDLLYSYNPRHQSWFLLTPSQSPRYLHSATIINGLMLIYGGNGHNSTHDNFGDRCFSSQFFAYEIACDSWIKLPDPTQLQSDAGLGRYGHSSVLYENSIYYFGGFNGIMLNSILRFTPGNCYHYTMQDECARTKPGVRCVWNKDKNICQPYNKLSLSSSPFSTIWAPCVNNNANFSELCQKQSACTSCVENSYRCTWCTGEGCQYEKCKKHLTKDDSKNLSNSICEDDPNCDKLHNCQACHTEYNCIWHREHKCYTYNREIENRTEKISFLSEDIRPTCEIPCHARTTCENCTQGSCMWCSSLHRCVESNAYSAVFPIAQCMEWTIHPWKCPGLSCSDIQACDRCLRNPRCGWCEDGSGTGVGICLEGSGTGPYTWDGTRYSLHNKSCPNKHWHFSDCPECQCNGHSNCILGTNVCHKPCKHLTEGSHCQYCTAGYYGNPINGGNCTPCYCHGHSAFCNRETGKCHCTTKGITGHLCDKCDEQNHYYGHPQEENGSCYYNLTMGYQYTFNMSKPDDRFYTSINFMNIPVTPDIDVEFMIHCELSAAYVNISIFTGSIKRILHEKLDCGNFKLRFSHDENLFGIDNTTFYVNVFSFTTPFVLQISFSQHRTLDLLQFFVTFSSCFLTLLIIAAILWKIKQRYDIYRRRQQMFVEMEQMASRPFAGVVVQINRESFDSYEASNNPSWIKSNNPTPIALEPCGNGKAAVLSLIVHLPTGGLGCAPPGQTGLAIASALVSLGTMEQKCNKQGDCATNKLPFNSSKCNNCTVNTTAT